MIKKARVPQEHALSAISSERHGLASPDMTAATTRERRAAMQQWADAATAAGRTTGFMTLHHTGQVQSEVRRRWQRLEARSARRGIQEMDESRGGHMQGGR